jgi:hypothetical protein
MCSRASNDHKITDLAVLLPWNYLGLPGHKSHKSTEIYTALSPDRFNEFVERPEGALERE